METLKIGKSSIGPGWDWHSTQHQPVQKIVVGPLSSCLINIQGLKQETGFGILNKSPPVKGIHKRRARFSPKYTASLPPPQKVVFVSEVESWDYTGNLCSKYLRFICSLGESRGRGIEMRKKRGGKLSPKGQLIFYISGELSFCKI